MSLGALVTYPDLDRRLANMGNSVFDYGELWATPSTAQARPTREHPTVHHSSPSNRTSGQLQLFGPSCACATAVAFVAVTQQPAGPSDRLWMVASP